MFKKIGAVFDWDKGYINTILGGGGENHLLEVVMYGGHTFLFFVCTFLGAIVEIFQNDGLIHNVCRQLLKNCVVGDGGRRLRDGEGGMNPLIMDLF